MKKKAEAYIETLELLPHPEGGHFKQVYKNPVTIEGQNLGKEIEGKRALATSIYFLLDNGEVSHLHRLKSDEMWYYHDGKPLTIVMIWNQKFHKVKLGLNITQGERPQVLVPAGTIFGSYNEADDGYSLVGCMVSFGFEFEDFELVKAEDLIAQFPGEIELINQLCLI